MRIDLSERTALVTGSTAGIGFAIAQGLAQAGATVAINGRTQTTVDAALLRLGRAPRCCRNRPARAARAWRPPAPRS